MILLAYKNQELPIIYTDKNGDSMTGVNRIDYWNPTSAIGADPTGTITSITTSYGGNAAVIAFTIPENTLNAVSPKTWRFQPVQVTGSYRWDTFEVRVIEPGT